MKDIEKKIEEMLIREAEEYECSVEEVKETLIEDWGIGADRGYGIFTSSDLELEHIERIDELDVYDDDLEAGEQAEKDGIKLIPFELNPKEYPYDCYRFIDTEENRKALKEIVKELEEENDDDFPTIEKIKQDYNELMEIIKDVKTIEKAKELENKFIIEINGLPINEFIKEDGKNEDIEWIRYEIYGCLSYIYDRFDGKPMFDVWCEYYLDEFIHDITIDDLTEELYINEKEKALRKY